MEIQLHKVFGHQRGLGFTWYPRQFLNAQWCIVFYFWTYNLEIKNEIHTA